jgi:hypothetical protein
VPWAHLNKGPKPALCPNHLFAREVGREGHCVDAAGAGLGRQRRHGLAQLPVTEYQLGVDAATLRDSKQGLARGQFLSGENTQALLAKILRNSVI